MDTLGQRIKQARRNKRVTQGELGRLCHGLSRSAVAQWEADKTQPTGTNLVAIADVLNVTPDWLVHGGTIAGALDRPRISKSFDENLLKIAIAAGISFIEANNLKISPERTSALLVEIYCDAQENLSDGLQDNPLLAVTTSAKAILRTLK